MSLLPMISCLLLGLGITFFLTPWIIRFCQGKAARTFVRELHHTHQVPVPRLGGLALVLAFLGTAAVVAACYPAPFQGLRVQGIVAFSAVAMFLLGFADDLRPIGARKKFFLQILIAAVVFYFGIRIEQFKDPFTGTTYYLGAWSGLITVLWLVGITNLINLIDGADGLAAGVTLMLMLLLAYVGTTVQNMGLLASGMAGALLGFLYYNFPPARIYMGDGGAYFLGFLIGILSIVSSHKGTVVAALISPLFVLALPIVDTFLALLRRGLRGLPLFRPDRKHIHHRLAEMGYSRRKVVLIVYGTTLVFLLMGFGAFWSQGRWVPILLGVLVLTFLVGARKLSFSREWFAVGRVLGNSLDMRRHVQYAMSLNRWFELEGERAGSVDELWQDFVLVTRKLGFSSVKLTLDNGEKLWVAETSSGWESAVRCARYDLNRGRAGVVEFTAQGCEAECGVGGPDACCMRCACATNSNLFLMLSELAAEGWHKAVAKWHRRVQLPLRFDELPAPAMELNPKPISRTETLKALGSV